MKDWPLQIETPRLTLRPFTQDDLDSLAALNADKEVMRYIGDGNPQSTEQTAARLAAILEHRKKHGFGLWSVMEKARGEWVGFCGLQFLEDTDEVEVGYRLARRFWGVGFASEAANASLRYGFDDLSLNQIVAVVHPENHASQRVVSKLGLRFIRIARFYNMDLNYYAISREHFNADDQSP
jgi:ribosomal-protein-alanine N-acetyltransferase